MEERTGRSFLWSLVESGGLTVVSLLLLLVVARLVGPAELGVLALAMGVVQFLTIFTETLFHDAIVQRSDLSDDHLSSAFWAALATGIAMTGATWAAAPWFAGLFDAPGLAPVLQVLGFSLLLSGMGSVPMAILRRNLRFKPLAVRSLQARVAAAAVGIGMAATGFGIWSLVAMQIVQVTLAALLVWPAVDWRPRQRVSPRCLGQLLAFGIMAAGSRIAWLGAARLFTLLVGYTLGLAAVGMLNVAQRIVDTLHDLLAGAAYNLGLPILSRRQGDSSAFQTAHARATEYACVATLPIFAGIAACAEPIVRLLLGEGWLGATDAIRILAFGTMVQFVVLFTHVAVMAAGRPGVIFGLSLISFGFTVGLLLVVRPETLAGATAIWAARSLATGPLLLLLFHRLVSPATSWSLWRAPLGATVACLAMVAMLTWLQIDVPLVRSAGALGQLLILVPAGATLYVVLILLFDRGAVQRLVAFGLAGLARRAGQT